MKTRPTQTQNANNKIIFTKMPPPTTTTTQRVLIVGNYCHDILFQNDAVQAESLGGAASFISNVLNCMSVQFTLVAKVGSDFKYPIAHPHASPIVETSSKTTVFHARFGPGLENTGRSDRVLQRVCACDPIRAEDLPSDPDRFHFGLAVGVAGEILPETLEKMIEVCDFVFVDIQALIREFDSVDGTVSLVKLRDSGFYELLPRIRVLKASSEEAVFMDVEEVRKWCCVVVTNGKQGCNVSWRDGGIVVSPFSANQVDPTGAGDSFLGGFVAGLVHGLSVPDAALLGNLFGSLTVEQIGLPMFDSKLLQRVKDEVQKRKVQSSCCETSEDELKFVKSAAHEHFHASLVAAKLVTRCSIQECQCNHTSSHVSMEASMMSHCTRQPNLLVNPMYEGPIRTVEENP